MSTRNRTIALSIAAALLVTACGTMGGGRRMQELQRDSIAHADFAGTWYVIANIPYALERNRVAARVEYIRRGDGRYRDLYIARKGSFDAPEKTLEALTWSLDPPANTHWRTRWFWPLTFDWAVLEHDAEHKVLVSGAPSRKYAWIFARSPDLDDAAYEAALDVLEGNGFERAAIRRVPQQASDLGREGFAKIEE